MEVPPGTGFHPQRSASVSRYQPGAANMTNSSSAFLGEGVVGRVRGHDSGWFNTHCVDRRSPTNRSPAGVPERSRREASESSAGPDAQSLQTLRLRPLPFPPLSTRRRRHRRYERRRPALTRCERGSTEARLIPAVQTSKSTAVPPLRSPRAGAVDNSGTARGHAGPPVGSRDRTGGRLPPIICASRYGRCDER